MADRWQTLCAVDFDKLACATYKANFPDVDVRCCTVAEALPTLPDCDVLLGGPPCQGFSTAGEGKGEDDERNAWPEMIDAIAAKKPRMFLCENVSGMLNERHLNYTRSVVRKLEALGYRVSMRLLDAVHYGVPQVRKRVWFWGIHNDVPAKHRWPEPTHYYDENTRATVQPDGLFDTWLLSAVTVGQALCIGSPGSKVKQYRWSPAMLAKHPPAQPAQTVQAKWFKGGAEGLLSVDGRTWDSRHPVPGPDEPATTVRALSPRDGGRCTEGVVAVPDGAQIYIRRLTPLECARLQSCPDDMAWPAKITKTAMYIIIGNGWACGMAAALSRALASADPQSRTVVSLFCGGGLGDLGWHQRYWSLETKVA